MRILKNIYNRGNCHSEILNQMREYYPKPHFLPEDCEIPSKEYIFMGYDNGATMHVRLLNNQLNKSSIAYMNCS